MNAPIVLFVYARPEHTRRTISALAANKLANESELIVYSDGPRGNEDRNSVCAVRDLLRTVTGFSSVTIHERERNYGLAQNIVNGLTEVFVSSKAVIVLEDDILCAPGFLMFMNTSLRMYEKNEKIWHINGWNYPLDTAGLPDVYCSKIMTCWGWGTWRDRWKALNTNAAYFMSRWSLKRKYKFNVYGTYPFYSHLIGNFILTKETWAVFWYATIYDSKGLCVTPKTTLTNELGSDGSGTHKLNSDMYISSLSKGEKWNFDHMPVEECRAASHAVANFNKLHFGLLFRLINSLKLLLPISVLRYYRIRQSRSTK